jgi:hypothetical protein
MDTKRLLRLAISNKLDWDSSSLMQKLEETVLSVGSRFSKIYNSCLVGYNISIILHSFSIALHVKLLNVRRELA